MRKKLPLSEAALLSRSNARVYCGCLGDDRFDREVGPHVTAKLIGGERFYLREQLDKWIGVDAVRPALHGDFTTMLDKVLHDNAQGARRPQKDI